MVDKILKGAKPGEHGKLELFVNRATARAVRIDLPRSLLSHADEVMEEKRLTEHAPARFERHGPSPCSR